MLCDGVELQPALDGLGVARQAPQALSLAQNATKHLQTAPRTIS